jgi:hypothetical protein
MRHHLLIPALLISITISAQTLKEADQLSAAKKHTEAADIYYTLGHYGKAAEALRRHISKQPAARRQKTSETLRTKIDRYEQLDRMTQRCEDIQIIDSAILPKTQLLEAYQLSPEAGALAISGQTTTYENQLKDRRYLSKSADGEPSRLHHQTRIQSEWTPPVPLDIPVDSSASDAYPFLLPDGLTLYFASTGNGSIGGYDIFTARYNLSTGTYLAPTQLGMPFNSTSNDYLYAIDESTGIGYFATDRRQEPGNIIIYTFIPNPSYKPIENATPDQLVNRAQITSIRDTWHEGKNYTTLLAQIKEKTLTPAAAEQKEFTLTINDNITYHTLQDFESPAARQSWKTALDAEQRIHELEEQTNRLRIEYKSVNSRQRRSLAPKILSAETSLEQLHLQYHAKQKEARNLEIRHLRTK